MISVLSEEDNKSLKVFKRSTENFSSSSYYIMRKSSPAICQFYKSSRGCKFGTNCRFVHSLSRERILESANNDELLRRDPICSSTSSSQQHIPSVQVKKNHDEPVNREISKTSTNFSSRNCYNFSKNGNCRFGSKCRFFHQRGEQDDGHILESESAERESKTIQIKGAGAKNRSHVRDRKNAKPLCQYFQAGSCRKGNACRFQHVEKADEFIEEIVKQGPNNEGQLIEKAQSLTIKDDTNNDGQRSASGIYGERGDKKPNDEHDEEKKVSREPRRQSARKPFIQAKNVIHELNREDATEKEILLERTVEVTQLKKRFTSDKLTELPKIDDQDVFHLIFSSSDPDWPYDVKLFELEIIFPSRYPLQPMAVNLPKEQNLPETVRRYVEVSIQEWIEEKRKQDEKRGVITKIFRPFLKWLDRSLESIVTEGLKQLQRELMAKAAGLEFIPASQLKKERELLDVGEESGGKNEQETADIGEQSGDDSSSGAEEPDFTIYRKDDVNEEVYLGPVETFSSGEEYEYEEDQTTEKSLDATGTEVRGTEMRMRNLQLRDAASTLVTVQIKLVIQCTRCHNRMDLKTPPGQVNALPCQKCNQSQLVNFRPVMAHQFSSVIGYLDVEGCTPFDLVMMDCSFKLGCMRCSKETNVKGLSPGQLLDVSCFSCYQKMKIAADSTRFTEISTSSVDQGDAVNIPVMKIKKIPKDPRIMLGSPLPDEGTCKHYRKSFRWFRFPCCGKVYPCDVCHDEKEDHEMAMANRMICGHCCKEQPFALEKPCNGCHQLMTKSRSSHWEGGKGCRDKTKMSKDDAKKYVNTNKTVSRKQQAKTKPAKKKEVNK